MGNFDPILGIHARAMQVRAKRQEVIANNLVNADTPGFKARDLNFKEVLRSETMQQTGLGMAKTSGMHISGTTPMIDVSLIEREGLQAAKDGNTVDAELEKVLFSKNSMDYQYELNRVDGVIKSMRLAIKGE